MAVLAPFAAIAGATLSAGSSIAGGIAQGNAASYQGQVARNNAIAAKQNAEYSAEAGAVREQRAGLRARQQAEGVRSQLAANGIDVNAGSAADVEASQRAIGRLEQNQTAHDAALESYGYLTQSNNYTAQSHLLDREAELAPIEGGIKGAGTLLSAVPDIPGSLLSGEPKVGSNYSWMTQGGNGATTSDLFDEDLGATLNSGAW